MVRVGRNKDTEKCKESNRRSLKKQRQTPLGKLRHTVAERVRGLLKRKGSSKPFSIGDILMYTMEDLKNHLEAQIETNSKPDKEKMSWDNYGYIWQIDHVKPVSAFELINNDNTPNIEEICKCFSLENLQPLYSRDNLAKSSWYKGKLYRNGKPI